MIDIQNATEKQTTRFMRPLRIEKVFLIVGWLISRLSNYLIFMS